MEVYSWYGLLSVPLGSQISSSWWGDKIRKTIFTHSLRIFSLLHTHINGPDFTYQRENASIHVSKRSVEFFNEEHIKLLDWPSNSPDLKSYRELVVCH